MLKTVFVEEAARLLGISRRTVYYRIQDGTLRTVRTPGGTQRVLVDSIAALLRARAGCARPAPAQTASPGSSAPAPVDVISAGETLAARAGRRLVLPGGDV